MKARLRDRFWAPGIRRDLRNAGLLSFVIYFVPQGMQVVGFPLGMLVFMALLDGQTFQKHNEAFLYLLAWQAATWAAWFWALRSPNIVRFGLAGPIAFLLTVGPFYWAALSDPLTEADVAALRPAEVGQWEETCSICGKTLEIASFPKSPSENL